VVRLANVTVSPVAGCTVTGPVSDVLSEAVSWRP
jgi:hypothetical protein